MKCVSISSLLGVRRWIQGFNGKSIKPTITRVSPRLPLDRLEKNNPKPIATTARATPIHIHPMTGNGTGLSSSETTAGSFACAAVKQIVIDPEWKKEEAGGRVKV